MSYTPSSRRILADRIVGTTGRLLRRTVDWLSPGQWLAVVVLAGSGAVAFGIAPDTTLDIPQPKLVARPLPLPQLATQAEPNAPLWREERVQRGDTIGSLLARAGVADAEALAWLANTSNARPLYQLRVGRTVRVATDESGRLAAMRFLTASGQVLTLNRDGRRFEPSTSPADVEIRHAMRSGVIASSLFAAADDADLPDSVTVALADVFAADIDFLQDLRRGDRFTVIYETRHIDGELVGTGRILAAEFVNRGKALRAFLWRNEDGDDGYFTEEARASRRAFLRSPMEFSRMTSGFSLARFHPILQDWRAHRGVDYAAPHGTPVRATGDGVVTFSGVQNGYGNVVIVQHGTTYSTLYAHLSQASVRTGERITQGETVGLVGATGWATGPHLHYEFRVAGEPRDPTSLALPTASPVATSDRDAFAAHVAPLAQQLAFARALPIGALIASD